MPRLVTQLVGKEGVSLKIANPEKYHFDPNELLSLLVKVILVFSESAQFILCMNEEGTLNMAIFKKAAAICKSRNLLEYVVLASGGDAQNDQQRMQAFIAKLEAEGNRLQSLDELLDSAPDEFLDEMTNELMKDPVMLPNSKMILDRSTIERLLMEKPVDPYDRTPLSKDQLIPRWRRLWW